MNLPSDRITSCKASASVFPVMSVDERGIQDQYGSTDRLDRLMSIVSRPESRNAYGICPFIGQTLKQHGLYSYYDETEIFFQACALVAEKMASGENIKNLPAYLKSIAFNKIRDLSKKKKQEKSLIKRLQNRSELIDDKDNLRSVYTTDPNVKALYTAFQNLDIKERDILILWQVKGDSWKEIGQYFVTIGEEESNTDKLVQRLRQKGHRALKRLRKFYHSH